MTETDKELLEWAAKAAGKNIVDWHRDGNGVLVALLDDEKTYWQPFLKNNLTDCMGDALRLACTLGLSVDINNAFYKTTVILDWGSDVSEDHGAGTGQATCRAIVRAAAEIGKGMKND